MGSGQSALGARIRGLREAAGVSQAGLAAAIGRHPAAVSRIESGARRVDAVELSAIAALLGVPTAALLSPEKGDA